MSTADFNESVNKEVRRLVREGEAKATRYLPMTEFVDHDDFDLAEEEDG